MFVHEGGESVVEGVGRPPPEKGWWEWGHEVTGSTWVTITSWVKEAGQFTRGTRHEVRDFVAVGGLMPGHEVVMMTSAGVDVVGAGNPVVGLSSPASTRHVVVPTDAKVVRTSGCSSKSDSLLKATLSLAKAPALELRSANTAA